MSLIELINNTRTDKNTTHSYIDLYENLFSRLKQKATNVIEVGIGPYYHENGGSIELWHKYFSNATIYAVDIIDYNNVYDGIKNNDKIKLFTSCNAYQEQFVKENFIDKNIKFDMLLDDGPHTLDSMIKFIELYSGLIADDGILVIEDVQDINWFNELIKSTPDELKQYINTYDLRHIKNRYDDLVFLINKSKK